MDLLAKMTARRLDIVKLGRISTTTTVGALFHIKPEHKSMDYDLACFLGEVISRTACLANNLGLSTSPDDLRAVFKGRL